MRARRDREEVGRATAGALSVAIVPGAVRSALPEESAGPARFDLWASAPVVSVRLEGTGRARLRVANLPRDAAVTGVPAAGVSAPTPTVREVEVDAPATIGIAPPDVATTRPVRFAFASDFHVDANLDASRAVIAAVNAEPDFEMLISAGDMVDIGASSRRWDRLDELLGALAVPCYATVGNHDTYFTRGDEYQGRLGTASTIFDYHGVRVALIDSGDATIAPSMYEVLDDALAAPGAGFRVFVTHIPPLDPAGVRDWSFGSRLEAERLLGLLARRGVDLTLYGHVHTYDAFVNAGIPAYVSGGAGGRPQSELDGIGVHFLDVTVDPAARTAVVNLRVLAPD